MATKTTAPDRNGQVEEPILELSTIAPTRPFILVKTVEKPDGETFELRILEEFGIDERQELLRDGNEYDALWNRQAMRGERPLLEDIAVKVISTVLEDEDDERRDEAMQRVGEEFDRLEAEVTDLSDAEKKRLRQLLDRMFDRVLIAPAKVKRQMSDSHRADVVKAFTFAPYVRAAREAERIEQEKKKSTTGT